MVKAFLLAWNGWESPQADRQALREAIECNLVIQASSSHPGHLPNDSPHPWFLQDCWDFYYHNQITPQSEDTHISSNQEKTCVVGRILNLQQESKILIALGH